MRLRERLHASDPVRWRDSFLLRGLLHHRCHVVPQIGGQRFIRRLAHGVSELRAGEFDKKVVQFGQRETTFALILQISQQLGESNLVLSGKARERT